MLRRIILENFMSHGRTEIDLADGLTVLTGPNNCGKSAVVAALQILANNGRSTHVMRHGEKRCRITVETDDGHTVCWERRKSTVKYTIDGEDIHRVGNAVPESLHQMLRLNRVEAETGKTTHEYDIHFGEQKSPVFLLGESGSRAASFFASSSDASRLVEMQHRHRQKLREQRSAAKRLTGELRTTSSRLKSFEPLDALATQITTAESRHQDVEQRQQTIAKLQELSRQLEQQAAACEQLRAHCGILERLGHTPITPTELRQSDQDAAGLQIRIEELENVQTRRARHASAAKHLQPLPPVPQLEPAAACRRLLDRLQQAATRRAELDQTGRTLGRLRPLPVLDTTAGLQTITTQLEIAHQQQRITRNRHAILKNVQPPEPELPAGPLQTLVCQLEHRQQTADRLITGVEALASLQPPASPLDVDLLTQLIGRLSEAEDSVVAGHQAADESRHRAADSEVAIRQFVEASPRCTMCGAELDPELLLSGATTAHQHRRNSKQGGGHTS